MFLNQWHGSIPIQRFYTKTILMSFQFTDVNECVEFGSLACYDNGVCTNTIGGYVCNCSAEYTGKRCDEGCTIPFTFWNFTKCCFLYSWFRISSLYYLWWYLKEAFYYIEYEHNSIIKQSLNFSRERIRPTSLWYEIETSFF
jgi:hypothetical protein